MNLSISNIPDILASAIRNALATTFIKRNLATAIFTLLLFAVWPFLLSEIVRGYSSDIVFAGVGTLLAFGAGVYWAARNEAEQDVPFWVVTGFATIVCLVLSSMLCDVLKIRGHETTIGAVFLAAFGWLAPKL
jgi:hypothetical protein